MCRQPQLTFRITPTTLSQHRGSPASCCACCSATLHQKMALSRADWLSVWRRSSIKLRNHQSPRRCSTPMRRMLSCLRLSHLSFTMTGEHSLQQHDNPLTQQCNIFSLSTVITINLQYSKTLNMGLTSEETKISIKD